MNLVQQRVIVEQADDKHYRDAAGNPIKLLDMSTGKFRVRGSAANFQHTQATDNKNKRQQQPIEITE